MNVWLQLLIGIPLIVDVVLKSTVLLLAAWAASRLLRGRNPRWRALLWRGTAVAMLAMPLLVAVTPSVELLVYLEAPTVLDLPATEESSVVSSNFPTANNGAEMPLNGDEPADGYPAWADMPAASLSDNLASKAAKVSDSDLAPRFPAEAALSAEAAPPWLVRHAPWLLALAWTLGVAALAFRWLIALRQVRRMIAACRPAPQPVTRRCRQVAASLGCRGDVEVRLSATAQSPLLVGFRKAIVLLPTRMAGAEYRDALSGIFAHELVHLRSRDLPWMVLVRVATTLFWFHPLAWRAAAAHAAACEEVSDALAARYVGDVTSYSGTLARVALEITGHVPALVGVPMARRPKVMNRLAILRRGVQAVPLTVRRLALAVALGGVVTCVLAGLRVVAIDAAAETVEATDDDDVDTIAADQTYQVVVLSDQGYPRPNAQVGELRRVFEAYRSLIPRRYSDEDGRIELSVEKGASRWWFAYSQGYRSMGLVKLPAQPNDKPLQVALTYGVSELEGRVVDRAGRPVAEREVEIQLTVPNIETIRLQSVKTDKEGRYTIGFVPTGEGLALVANLAGESATTRIDLPRGPKKILATPLVDRQVVVAGEAPQESNEAAVRFGGRVVDEQSKVVSEADVTVNANVRRGNFIMIKQFTARTDQNGRWSIETADFSPDLGLRGITIEHPRFISNKFSRQRSKLSLNELQAGTATAVLKQGIRVRGTVYDANGKPLPDARVLTSLNSFTPGPIMEPIVDGTMTRSDEQGRFTTCALPPGKHYLAFYGLRHAPQTVPVTVKPDALEIEVHMQRGETLQGQIVNPQDEPLADVNIGIVDWQSPQEYSAVRWDRTDAIGQFTIEHVPTQGSYNLKFYSLATGEYVSGRVNKADIDPGEPLTLTLGPIEPVTIVGKVLDAETKEPIGEFEIIESSRGLNKIEFGHGQHTEQTSADGAFRHELKGSHALRIHAAGYYPVDTRMFVPGDGTEQITLELTKGPAFLGKVVDAEGQPVEGADVVWIGPQRQARVKENKLALTFVNLAAEYVTKTDSKGQFELPPSRDEGIIAVVHPSGYLEIPSPQFSSDKPLQLSAWCRFEGVLTRNGKPAAEESVEIQPKGGPQLPRVLWTLSQKTDAQGRFVIEHVPPLPLRVGYMIGSQLSHVRQIVPEPGRTNTIEIGGRGAAVSGRIAASKGLEIARFADEFNTFQHMTKVFAYPRTEASLPKKQRVQYVARLSDDGHFQLEDVPPGEYQIEVAIHAPVQPNSCGVPIAIAASTVSFDVLDDHVAGKSIELPPLVLQLRPGLSMGQALPEISARTIMGRPIDLNDYRGQLLVLDFWATWCAPCVAEIPRMKQLYKTYSGSDGVAFVGINLDDSPKTAQAFVLKKQIPWPQLSAPGWGDKNRLLGQFGVTSVPSLWLIDSEGKVLARDLRAAQLEEALQNAGARRPG